MKKNIKVKILSKITIIKKLKKFFIKNNVDNF